MERRGPTREDSGERRSTSRCEVEDRLPSGGQRSLTPAHTSFSPLSLPRPGQIVPNSVNSTARPVRRGGLAAMGGRKSSYRDQYLWLELPTCPPGRVNSPHGNRPQE